MAQSGLLGWANSVRMTMASDPGRKRFQEEVHLQGFSFLDDYLDNILYGAKQDPLIELVKTPGRKKAITRKPTLASKLAQVVAVSHKEDGAESTKENVPPASSLHQALLNARELSNSSTHGNNLKQGHASPFSLQPRETTTRTPEAERPQPGSVDVSTQDRLAVSAHVQSNELSVIAEDDEAIERSRTSIQLQVKSQSQQNTQDQAAPMQVDNPVQNEILSKVPNSIDPAQSKEDVHMSSTSSVATFHSLPLNSPSSEILKEVNDPEEGTTVDITVPIRDSEMHVPSSKPPTHKAALPTLPTLPEPMPLRKSVRAARDPSVGNVMSGGATPGTAAAGKRTSWLMKAREVKAMEAVPKKSIVGHQLVAVPAHGAKRKSEEALGSKDHADEERLPKAIKMQKDETAPLRAVSSKQQETKSKEPTPVTDVTERPGQDGMLDLLKKRVQGLEARNDKHSNKASGGAAVELAEARAQAEARIAERNHKEEGPLADLPLEPSAKPDSVVNQLVADSMNEGSPGFNTSDLFPSEGRIKDRSKVPEKTPVLQSQWATANIPAAQLPINRESTSTTPPHSPPAQSSSFTLPQIPVFNKPTPVFVPPVPSARPLPTPPSFQDHGFSLPSLPAFSKPASMTLGISPRILSPPSTKPTPLSAQSTAESIRSDAFFDDRGDTEAWVPSTQDTEYSSAFGSQQQPTSTQQNALDEDDSWPIDEKISQGVHWPFGGPSKEDSMTWSTLPSQSQRADTGQNLKGRTGEQAKDARGLKHDVPVGFGEDMDIEKDDYSSAAGLVTQDPELEELILSGAKPTVTLVESGDSHGQGSVASSVSSQSQVGFFGQASKFLSSALGTSKKSKPEVKKVIQKAAVAAKKQQEDDKKVVRLKEMEHRRQLAIQRKAEEEKARQQEQERKAKEEIEKRRREREEQAEKKPLKTIPSSASIKKDDEAMKKRKVEQDKVEKKQEIKKQTPLGKPGFKPISKQAGALSSSAAFNSSQAPGMMSSSTVKPNDALKHSKVPTTIPTKGKNKPSPKTPVADEELAQPSQILQTQMAARAKAAMQPEPLVPSEKIELPEVNSEYSDSDDENRPKTFNPPGWAQSPELRQALQAQSTINPDDIFGAVKPLRMEEMFKARTSRFRARTSSANWSGADRLTVEEEQEYARRMGFK